jgi:ubiquinone/menaquinone biosynthesis C-methylase UbiE
MPKQADLGFGSGGKSYDSNRPTYTDESVHLIVSEIVSTSKTIPGTGLKYDVLELGAGTGKMTERLRKKLPENMKYLASEPSENFLGVLKSKG